MHLKFYLYSGMIRLLRARILAKFLYDSISKVYQQFFSIGLFYKIILILFRKTHFHLQTYPIVHIIFISYQIRKYYLKNFIHDLYSSSFAYQILLKHYFLFYSMKKFQMSIVCSLMNYLSDFIQSERNNYFE